MKRQNKIKFNENNGFENDSKKVNGYHIPKCTVQLTASLSYCD